MADTQKIEYAVMQDIKARLEAEPVTPTVIVEHTEQPQEATFIRVRSMSLQPALQGGKIPTGERRDTIAVDVHSYQDDDQNGETLHNITSEARAAIFRSDILSLLDGVSSFISYYGLEGGNDVADYEDGYRMNTLTFDLILQPQK